MTPEQKERLRAMLPPEGAEATAWPVWYICVPVRLGRPAASSTVGPFFSRESAQSYLDAHAYRYSDKAIVWCASAYDAPDWRELITLLREVAREA